MFWISLMMQILFAFDACPVSGEGEKHRCYVCIPNTGSSISDVIQLFPRSTAIPLCNHFETTKSEYIRECPSPNYQGCLTQTNGTHVTKTCTEIGVEDCKSANKIKYCYCKGDLCNKEAVPIEALATNEAETEDDEDSISEGSGSTESFYSKEMETSSEENMGIKITERKFSTTKSVIMTTTRPEGKTAAKAFANLKAQFTDVYCVLLLIVIYVFQ